MYDVSTAKVMYSGSDILAVLLLGVIGGILGSLYNYLIDKVLRVYSIINEYVLPFSLACILPFHMFKALPG